MAPRPIFERKGSRPTVYPARRRGCQRTPVLARCGSSLAMVLLMGFGGVTWAREEEDCGWLRQQRDALATAAMEQEIALARTLRGRLCPDLASRGEVAHALNGPTAPIDYGAWSRCRLEAERQLEAGRPMLYRNSKGFSYYTPAGATLARQADERLALLKSRPCP